MALNENKFYKALEDIFVGAPIEGEGGYVNLLSIKQKYYSNVIECLKNDISKDPIISDSFREDFYNLLYSFFEKYFSECGSVYFAKTANWQRVYEKVYTDTKDVVLFWKTHMLYYVKSDILFRSIYIKAKDDKDDTQYVFYFDVGELQQKQNNEKKELVFSYKETKTGRIADVHDDRTGDKTFVLSVNYSERGRKTDYDALVRTTGLKLDIIEKAISTFKKQTTVDFFINKNAKAFLEEQLDLFLHQLLLEDESVFEQDRLDQIKAVKKYAKAIISFISQFENELVRIWNKPRFVINSNYVISIDRLSNDLINKIATHPNLTEQIKEWANFGMVDDSFNLNKEQLSAMPHLPVDTKYFKDLELEILASFDNIDDKLDGRLIHSENYQALNTLQARYRRGIQTIYIDPPFNTGKDFQYVDGYQDSTWCTLMDNRFDVVRKLLNGEGSFFLHLDERADYYGRILLESFHFDSIKQIAFHTMAATDEMASTFGMKNVSARNFVQESQTIFYGRYQGSKFFKLWKPNRRTSKLGIGWMDLIALLKEGGSSKSKNGYNFYIEKYNGNNLELFEIPQAQSETIYTMGDIWNDILSMSQSTVRQHGENISFQGQKPEELLRRIIQTSTEKRDIVLDYFAGTGTTAAVAHKLSRRWITVEQGEHFNNFYVDIDENGNEERKLGCLGRLKQVVMGDQVFTVPNSEYRRSSWLSKEIDWHGGGFFKYYDLEQYEDTLSKVHYSPNNNELFASNPFSQYVFFADRKLTDVLEASKDGVTLDFDKLYENIDFPETISLLYGEPIERITEDEVKLAHIEKPIKYNVAKMDNAEKVAFVKLLKPLLWWGE